MRSRLIVLAAAGASMLLAGGDAFSRQPAPGAAPGAAAPRPTRVNPAVVNRVPGATTPPPQGPGAGGGVDWKSAVGDLRRANAAGAGDQLAGGLDKAEIDKTRLPILLPLDPGLMAKARLYSFGDFYTISADLTGAGLSFSGNAAPIPVGTKLNVKGEGPANLVVQRTVEGQIASFTRYGALYTVEITCVDLKDTRCRDQAFIRQMVGKMNGVVLGKAARQAAGLGG